MRYDEKNAMWWWTKCDVVMKQMRCDEKKRCENNAIWKKCDVNFIVVYLTSASRPEIIAVYLKLASRKQTEHLDLLIDLIHFRFLIDLIHFWTLGFTYWFNTLSFSYWFNTLLPGKPGNPGNPRFEPTAGFSHRPSSKINKNPLRQSLIGELSFSYWFNTLLNTWIYLLI